MNALFPFADDLSITEDEEFLLIDLDLEAAIFGKEDLFANLDRDGNDFALVIGAAGTDGNNSASVDFGLGALRQNDTALRDSLGNEALDEDTVQERSETLTGRGVATNRLLQVRGTRQLAESLLGNLR